MESCSPSDVRNVMVALVDEEVEEDEEDEEDASMGCRLDTGRGF